MSTSVTGTAATAATTATTAKSGTATTDASDRFLKLLVTQMQNQDPLNPMDNAQVTSQMAQINTVTGIDKLNTTMTGMNTSMSTNLAQMQILQGASLVGHSVLMEGNQLNLDANGSVTAGFDLANTAANVRIDIQNSAGVTIDTLTQSGVAAGQQGFTWTASNGQPTSGLSFKVTAGTGAKTIAATPLMTDTVDAISTASGNLTLELRSNGSTAYSKIKSVS
jgi:flagellar basal-body rod modification protein FlgD